MTHRTVSASQAILAGQAVSVSQAIWTINGRYATQRMTGVQRYAHEIVSAIDEIIGDNPELAQRLGFELAIPPDTPATPDLQHIPIRRTGIGSGQLWEQLILPWYLKSGMLSLGNLGPVMVSRQVVCIHDANVYIQPESYSLAFRSVYQVLQPLIAKRSRKVATVSQFSADMLVKYGLCQTQKIFIAPNGHEHILKWDASRAKLALLRQLTRPYVLLLGSKAKHKNVNVVLASVQAFDQAGIDVVVVGGGAGIFSGTADVDHPNVHYTGYVGDDDLAALYEGALCLTFPSTTEGFGIPPLEAMAKGCPVVCSDAASLQEVGGDAVLYADPARPEAWRDAVLRLAADANLRVELMAKGHQRAKAFSWKTSAGRYLDELLKMG